MICINHSKFVCIWEVGWPPRATQNKFVFQVICAHKPLKKYRKFIWIIVEVIWKLHCPKDRRKSGPSERILPKHLKLRSHKDNFEITGEWIQTGNKMSQRKNRLFNNKQCHIILPCSSTISARRTYTHTRTWQLLRVQVLCVQDQDQRTYVFSLCAASPCPQSNACSLLLTNVCGEENVNTTHDNVYRGARHITFAHTVREL